MSFDTLNILFHPGSVLNVHGLLFESIIKVRRVEHKHYEIDQIP